MAIRLEKNGPVSTIVLERPEVRNAVDAGMAQSLALAFRELESDPETRVGVLWGSGGHFCAGADLSAIAAGQGNRVAADGDGPMGPTRMFLDKPVIAAISGYAVAGGLELAMWCDLRVMESSATLGVFCRRFGVPLVDGGTVRLPRLIGLSRALDLILTGRPVDSEEALAIGLANRVVEDGTSRQAAEALAHQIAEFPPICLRNDRRSVYEGLELPLEQALRTELARGLSTLSHGEAHDGASRFVAGVGRHGTFDGQGSDGPTKKSSKDGGSKDADSKDGGSKDAVSQEPDTVEPKQGA